MKTLPRRAVWAARTMYAVILAVDLVYYAKTGSWAVGVFHIALLSMVWGGLEVLWFAIRCGQRAAEFAAKQHQISEGDYDVYVGIVAPFPVVLRREVRVRGGCLIIRTDLRPEDNPNLDIQPAENGGWIVRQKEKKDGQEKEAVVGA